MKLEDAMNSDNLLCFEMNGKPLPRDHGYPVRLIAPGWYGVANVKWLTRIEVIDHRFAGRFMARDYVRIREDETRPLDVPDRQPRPLEVSARQGRAQRRPVHDLRRRVGSTRSPRSRCKIDDGPWRRGGAGRSPSQAPVARVRVEVLDAALAVAFGRRARDHVPRHRRRRQHPARPERPVPGRAGGRSGRPTAGSPVGSTSPDASRLCVTTYVVDRVFGDTSLEANTTKRLTTPRGRRRLCSTEWLNKEDDGGRRAVPGVLGPGRSDPA